MTIVYLLLGVIVLGLMFALTAAVAKMEHWE
jgi:hypothetical protein